MARIMQHRIHLSEYTAHTAFSSESLQDLDAIKVSFLQMTSLNTFEFRRKAVNDK